MPPPPSRAADRNSAAAAAARDVCVMEGVKASAATAVVSVVAHLAATRLSPAYVGANYRLKTLLWSSVVVSAFWVRSEQEATRQGRLSLELRNAAG
jgi:hypothetical protein